MDIIWENIKQIARKNHGDIKNVPIEAVGIRRPMLKNISDKGYLHSVRKGIYAAASSKKQCYFFI